MAERRMGLEITRQHALVPAKRTSTLTLIGVSVSVLVHAIAAFALLHLEPAQAVDGGAQEIPVDVVIEATASEPSAPQPEPQLETDSPAVTPPPAAAPKVRQQTAPPEATSSESKQPLATQTMPRDPGPPLSSRIVARTAAQTSESLQPKPELPSPALQAATIAAPPLKAARPELPRPIKRHEDIAQRRRQEDARRRKRVETEARKKDAEEKRAAEAKRRAEAQRRRTALEHAASLSVQRSSTATLSAGPANYHSTVLGRLAEFKHYPESARARGAEGQAVVAFTLDNAGRVVSARIVRSSGQTDIDAATLAMVRRANPFPAPPPDAQHSFTAAIQFHLK